MEIPSNELRIKNRVVQETRDVASKRVSSSQSEVAPTKGTGGEQIALSSKAKDIQKAHEAIRNSADVRIEKVNAIKAKIESGEYHIPSDVLAERVLKEIITEAQFTDL